MNTQSPVPKDTQPGDTISAQGLAGIRGTFEVWSKPANTHRSMQLWKVESCESKMPILRFNQQGRLRPAGSLPPIDPQSGVERMPNDARITEEITRLERAIKDRATEIANKYKGETYDDVTRG